MYLFCVIQVAVNATQSAKKLQFLIFIQWNNKQINQTPALERAFSSFMAFYGKGMRRGVFSRLINPTHLNLQKLLEYDQ